MEARLHLHDAHCWDKRKDDIAVHKLVRRETPGIQSSQQSHMT